MYNYKQNFYILRKPYPGREVGDLINFAKTISDEQFYWVKTQKLLPKEFHPSLNPEWFSPWVLDTIDVESIFAGDTFYVVVGGKIKEEVARKSIHYPKEGFYFADREVAKMHLLKEEAKLRYPIGCTVICLDKTIIYKITSHFSVVDNNQIWFMSGTNGVKVHDNGIWSGHTDEKGNPFPLSWDSLSIIEGYSIKSCFNTEKQAKSANAAAKLSQLLAVMNGDWEPDWTNFGESKYAVIRHRNNLIKSVFNSTFHHLVFRTEMMRDFSYIAHRSLWEQYWEI